MLGDEGQERSIGARAAVGEILPEIEEPFQAAETAAVTDHQTRCGSLSGAGEHDVPGAVYADDVHTVHRGAGAGEESQQHRQHTAEAARLEITPHVSGDEVTGLHDAAQGRAQTVQSGGNLALGHVLQIRQRFGGFQTAEDIGLRMGEQLTREQIVRAAEGIKQRAVTLEVADVGAGPGAHTLSA